MFERFIQDLLVIAIKIDKGTWRLSKYTEEFIGKMYRLGSKLTNRYLRSPRTIDEHRQT